MAGRFKVGYWTPLEIDIEAGAEEIAARLELVAPDGDGVPGRVHAPLDGPLKLAAGERKTVPLYAKLGQLTGEVTVRLLGEDGPLATRRFQAGSPGPLAGVLPSGSTLIVSIGAPPPAGAEGDRALRGFNVAHVSNLQQLPTDWWGYEGVDTVIITTGDQGIRSQLSAGSASLAAIDLWVRMGGQLIFSVGRTASRCSPRGRRWRRSRPAD